MSAALSGRVGALENSVNALIQDGLQKPDITAYSQLSSNWNQQFTNVSNTVAEIEVLVRALQASYANLYYYYTQLNGIVTGHTGNTGIHTY